MNITNWVIKNNQTSFILIALIVVLGLYTFFTISRLEEPEIVVHNAVVITAFPGASPEKVENLALPVFGAGVWGSSHAVAKI